MNNTQKAELEAKINKMKQGNPPATEGEIATVIEYYTAQPRQLSVEQGAEPSTKASDIIYNMPLKGDLPYLDDYNQELLDAEAGTEKEVVSEVPGGPGQQGDYKKDAGLFGEGTDGEMKRLVRSGDGWVEEGNVVKEEVADFKREDTQENRDNSFDWEQQGGSFSGEFNEKYPKTWINKSEDVVVPFLKNNNNFPGLGVKEAGVMFGDALTYTLPNGENYHVDLQDDENEVGKLQYLRRWYNDPENAKKASLGLYRTLSSSSTGSTRYHNAELSAINTSLEKMADGGGNSYSIEGHQAEGEARGIRAYTLTNNSEVVGTFDMIGGVQAYLWENITDKEIGRLQKVDLDDADALIVSKNEAETTKYRSLTGEDAQTDFYTSGDAEYQLIEGVKDLDLSAEDMAVFNALVINRTGVAAAGDSYAGYSSLDNSVEFGFSHLDKALRGETVNLLSQNPNPQNRRQVVSRALDNLSEDAINKIQLVRDGLTLNSEELNKRKREMADTYGSAYFQTELKKHHNYRGIQTALDAQTSEVNVAKQYDAHKATFRNLEEQAGVDLKRLQERGETVFKDIEELNKNGESIGWETTTFPMLNPGRVIITGDNKDLVKKYQIEIDEYYAQKNNIYSEYEKENKNNIDSYDKWVAKAEEYNEAAGISNRELGTFKLIGGDFMDAWENMALSVPAFFGSEQAMDGIDALNAGAKGNALDLHYQDAWELGEFTPFVLRSTAKQLPNVIAAIALSQVGVGLALPAYAGDLVIATNFAMGAGGNQRVNLRNLVRASDQAEEDLFTLESRKANMDPEEYKRQKVELEKTQAIGDLDPWQIESAVYGAAIVEGGTTFTFSRFGGGKISNTSKIAREIGLKSRASAKGLGKTITNTPWQAAKDFGWDFSKRVGGEVLEEEIIMMGSELVSSLVIGGEVDFSEWDETLVQTLIIAGPINGLSGGYSTVTQHMATQEYRDIYKDVKNNLAKLEREFADPKNSENQIKKLRLDYGSQLERLSMVTSGMEIDAMVAGVDNLERLYSNSLDLNALYEEAKIDHRDSPDDKKQLALDHVAVLSKKSKTEAQSYSDRANRVFEEQAEIQAEIALKYDANTALEEGGIIESVYGPKGLKMAVDMAAKDPLFKKKTAREQLLIVHNKIKQQFRDSRANAARRDPKIRDAVEALIYDEVDEDGNKLEGGKEAYFERTGRKRRTSKQVALENYYYNSVGVNQNAMEVEAITLNKDVALKAPPGITEADIKSFDDILDNKGEIVTTAAQQLEDFINKLEGVGDSKKKDIINLFAKGELNGTIIDGKYIVLDAAQAKKNLAEGNLLQATAVLHEYSHFLDNVTMKDGEMVQMAENLNKSLESNPKLKALHDAVVERGAKILDSKGNPEYNKDLPFSEQSNDAKEEYVKYAEEMILHREFWQELNEAKKAGGGIANTLKKFTGGDYNFDSDGAALHYIVEYGQSWQRGEDSKLVERKKKAFVPRSDSKESISSNSRSARDGFAEKSIAEDLGLKESTKKIVAKNEEIYQRIVNAAEASGVKVSKKLVTQRMKDELVENNLARAFALARRAAGVAKNLTLDEGLKIDNVTEWFQEYSLKLAELSNTWDPSKNDSFGAYMNQLLPKKYSGILKALKSDLETSSMDTDEGTRARAEAVAVEEDTAPRSDTRRKKTNVLKIGKVEGKVDAIKDAVEVNPGDTFKEVSDNNTGKVAEIIFDVPANKITDPKKNLTYAKRIVNGIPEASEAGNIQSFYIAPQTVEKLLKILPEESVSSDTADINEIGENIDVDREVLGRGLGLSNRVLNSFYEKTNKRSKGKKSQPFIWKLKPEFKNPTAETIAKVQADLGITPRGELNNYNRDIGQLLKGVAKFQAQQTALSTAQRILTERKASKKQIASVTAAQSKVAFSQTIKAVEQLIGKFMRQNLSMDDAKFRDNLLLANKLAPTLRINSPEDIKVYINMLKRDVFPLLPYEAWFGPGKGTAFTTTSKSVGLETGSDLWALFQSEMQALKADDSIKYGAEIKGVDMPKMWSLRNKYKPLFSTPEKARENIKNGKIAEFNEQVGLIHKALWKRINKSIKNDRESASGIATYLGLTANDTGHWHKMGAQFAGFSTELTKRKKDKKGKDQKTRVEYEHAMPATQAYLYLLNAAINHNESFDYAYGKIIENYKLIALDKAMDDKLRYARTKSGKSLMTNMTDGWNPETGSWWERYFNDIAYMQDGGIDPSSIEGLDGKTFAEKLNINAQGIDPAFESARDIDARDEDSKVMGKAIKASRSSKPKGISVLDFDDTLATTKSNVLFTNPNVKGLNFKLRPGDFYATLGEDTTTSFSNPELLKGTKVKMIKGDFYALIGDRVAHYNTKNGMYKVYNKAGESMGSGSVYENITYAKFQDITKNQAKDGNPYAEGRKVTYVQGEMSGVRVMWLNRDSSTRGKGYGLIKVLDANGEPMGSGSVADPKMPLSEFIKKAKNQARSGGLVSNPRSVQVVQGTLNAEEFAEQGGDLLAQGIEFDFSEFNKVVDGKTAPLFNKAMKLAGKFGTENMFVLTARAPESQLAIKQFLDAQGLKIPLKNITGLGKSEASAKANWIAEKVGEGYNDFYFADDAIQNVDAVREKLNELEVKNKVQQAKIKFSMNTKRDLDWKSTDKVTFNLEGNRVTEGKIYNASFKVGDNEYIIRLTNRSLDVSNKSVKGDSVFDLEFALENQADELWEGAGKMGVEGTGRASEVLSIVSNGVMDFIKNNDVDAIGFSSADTSRTRLYNTLTKFWASRLGWEWTSQTFKPDKRTGEDFTGGKFIISNPNATKPIVEAPVASESDFSNRSTEEKNMLDMFDIKGKVQRAKIKFSQSGPKRISDILDLNVILEQSKGIGKNKTFSAAKARQRGKGKGRFKFFVPPSADDFAGLMYAFMGKGEQGNKHHAWFKENLFDPFSKGMRRHKIMQQQVANDIKTLRKAIPEVRKKLNKKVPGTEYTHEDAIRIYNWTQAGFDIPGLSRADQTALVKAIESNAQLQAFAKGVNSINETTDGMPAPGDHWTGGNIALDLNEALEASRSTHLQQWIENKNVIFDEANMNKIEAVYGPNFREALEDSLWRMENGGTRSKSGGRLVNNFTSWIHGSIGTTMFLNARSAMLQMISNVNFVNWSDNNMLKAAGAFANQPQYWKDVSMIFNSPFLKQRRSGIQTDVNAAELLAQVKDSKNKLKAATAYLLQLGFTPTQIADSFAIATGGATFYRNRTKTYLKQGMTQADAETKAFEDMMEIAEETQQSTREDKISQQQASPLGKFILAFQNTPMQYNRLIKKATQDLVNGRGDPKANISRIVYYAGIQNMIFYGLQQALFATLFSDDEEDEISDTQKERVVNGMIDTILRGSGIAGVAVSTLKNVVLKFMKESEKMDDGEYYTDPDWGNVVIEALNISPPIGIKARKIYSGLKTWEYNNDVIDQMDKTDIDNPIYDAVASVTEAVTNIPLSRLYNKVQNVSEALNAEHDTWKRVAMLLGWSKWSFGIKNQDVVAAKGEVKAIKAEEKVVKAEKNKIIKAEERAVEEAVIIEENIEIQKEERKAVEEAPTEEKKKEAKEKVTCAAVNKSGNRCGSRPVGDGAYCTIHEKVEAREDGKKVQCSQVKTDGKRCKMKTNNKSGKCYYHD